MIGFGRVVERVVDGRDGWTPTPEHVAALTAMLGHAQELVDTYSYGVPVRHAAFEAVSSPSDFELEEL
jgi:hypothetical protein